MATHPSILVGRIPWTERSLAPVHRVMKSQTWLSDFFHHSNWTNEQPGNTSFQFFKSSVLGNVPDLSPEVKKCWLNGYRGYTIEIELISSTRRIKDYFYEVGALLQ